MASTRAHAGMAALAMSVVVVVAIAFIGALRSSEGQPISGVPSQHQALQGGATNSPAAYPNPVPAMATDSSTSGGVYANSSFAEIADDLLGAMISAGLAVTPTELVYSLEVTATMASDFGLDTSDIAHESPTDALIVLSGTFSLPAPALGHPLSGTSVPDTTAILYILDRYSGSVRLEASSPSLQDLLDEYGLD